MFTNVWNKMFLDVLKLFQNKNGEICEKKKKYAKDVMNSLN